MAALKREGNTVSEKMIDMDNIHTILGAESSFEGKLSFEGTVRIDGNYKGEIATNDMLVVGQSAKLEAEIKVGSIVVNGEVHGNIIANNIIELRNSCRMYGNITAPQLIIDKGVIFEGNCKMDRNPKPLNKSNDSQPKLKDEEKQPQATA